MRIVGKENVGTDRENRTIYVVEVTENIFVDVMHRKTPSNLIYVMDQPDGGIAYDNDGTILDVTVNYAEVVNFVAATLAASEVVL